MLNRLIKSRIMQSGANCNKKLLVIIWYNIYVNSKQKLFEVIYISYFVIVITFNVAQGDPNKFCSLKTSFELFGFKTRFFIRGLWGCLLHKGMLRRLHCSPDWRLQFDLGHDHPDRIPWYPFCWSLHCQKYRKDLYKWEK